VICLHAFHSLAPTTPEVVFIRRECLTRSDWLRATRVINSHIITRLQRETENFSRIRRLSDGLRNYAHVSRRLRWKCNKQRAITTRSCAKLRTQYNRSYNKPWLVYIDSNLALNLVYRASLKQMLIFLITPSNFTH
jgi:hypothetical protein